MNLTAEIKESEAPREYRRFIANTGLATWERKITKIEKLHSFPLPCPNLYRDYLANRNPLIRDVATFLSLEREGKAFRRHSNDQMMKTGWYLKVINNLFRISPEVTKKLKAIVLDDETTRSFLFEIDIATNFFRKDFDVEFVDLEDKGRFDLLVSDGNLEVEVECKTKSADAGRKVATENFNLLCDVLVSDLKPLSGCFALVFKCDGRLSGNQELFHSVAAEINRCRTNSQHSSHIDALSFEIKNLPVGTQIRTNREAAAALSPYLSEAFQHYFVMSGPATLVIVCESMNRDRVLKSIYNDLKRGASQLSKKRPSILACRIEDIDDEDWDSLSTGSGLAAMSTRLLGGKDRGHVNHVIYSSDQTLPSRHSGVVNCFSTNLGFKNQNPSYQIPETILEPTAEFRGLGV